MIVYRWEGARLTVWNTETGATMRLVAFGTSYAVLRENSELACLFALAPDCQLPRVALLPPPDDSELRPYYDRESIRSIEAGWQNGSTRSFSTTPH